MNWTLAELDGSSSSAGVVAVGGSSTMARVLCHPQLSLTPSFGYSIELQEGNQQQDRMQEKT